MPTSTSQKSSDIFAGNDSYPVFPNPNYISRFYMVSSEVSGITQLDTDLYNFCYLPANPLHYWGKRDGSSEDPDAETLTSTSWKPKPTYQFDKPPCRRAAAINANCYFENTNGTFSGLQPYEDNWEIQQECFCKIYPYFDSVNGCNECFKDHGGIEGYHWFPASYMSAASSSYCNASPITTGFYPFVTQWSRTNEAAKVPTTTAPNILGTETAASAYWTYATAITTASGVSGGGKSTASVSTIAVLLAFLSSTMLGLVATI
ncbi:hypothetical protein TWF694_010105 [Orbilia ellipsospora]|uniref:Uncharacterized protein n=1 Tax=Orbilia ellipsospora TaxID=2528407 RepID=A0AAV9X8W2_9PEZI